MANVECTLPPMQMVGSLTINKINRNLLIHLNRFLESLPLFLKECYKKLLTILSTPGNIENAVGGGGVPRLYPPIVHFTVLCLVAKPLIRSEAKGDLVMIQTLLLFKCKFVIMLTRYWSLSQQGQLQPHSKSKA